jgi:hypothetical protein
VAAAVVASALAGVGSTLPAHAASGTTTDQAARAASSRGDSPRGWLSGAIASGEVREPLTPGTAVLPTAPSAPSDPSASAARAGASRPGTRSAASTATGDSQTSAAGTLAATPQTCDSGLVRIGQLTDRTVVTISLDGAATTTVLRQREYGAWLTLGTITGPTGQFVDRTINPRTVYHYRVIAKSDVGATVTDCQTYGDLGIWTGGAWGEPDAVYAAGTGGLMQTSPYDEGMAAATGSWVTPSYSADGRLVAGTLVDETTGAGVLKVLSARTGTAAFTVDLGATVFAGEAAFSPDGQSLVFARYDAASGAPLGLGVVDVHGTHVVRLLTPDRPLAEPTWKPDSRTIVATDLTTGGGLVTLCSTCSVTTAIPGTAGGYTAEVFRDGAIWFGWANDAGSELRRLSGGSVTTVRGGPGTSYYAMPRLLPDGQVYVEVDRPVPNDPTAYYPTVVLVGSSPSADDEMWIGRSTNGFLGYDLRQPLSKGTSDFVGDAFHDLLAKDASGVLWAYPGTNTALGRRVRLGGGWNGYTAYLAVGDLTSDDRADLLAKDSSGKLWLYAGLGGGTFAPRRQVGSGFGTYTLVAAGDLNGDDLADLVAKDSAGALWLYSGRGTGAIGGRVLIGSGWNGMTAIIGSGDVNFDGQADLLARSRDGKLWLFPGTGASNGRLGTARQVGSGWGGFTAVTVTEVVNQRPFVWVRSSAGVLSYYDMYADGSFSPNGAYQLGGGWGSLVLSS